jgi:hypothetical protein
MIVWTLHIGQRRLNEPPSKMVGLKREVGILTSLGIAPFHKIKFDIIAICLFFMQNAWSLWLLTTIITTKPTW